MSLKRQVLITHRRLRRCASSVRLLSLSRCEQMKKSLVEDASIETSTITDESAGSAYVENFAIKVFLQADDEDRAGKANK